MAPIDAFWHLASLFAPAVGVGVIASLLAKLLWRERLKRVSWGRLCRWASGVSAVVLMAGLIAFGRDGKMTTYAAMVVACALALWSVGFIGRGKG